MEYFALFDTNLDNFLSREEYEQNLMEEDNKK
jgi:hypothetical protein